MKYSFLMSVYFKEKPIWLRESINSMLKQTVQADEIVIVKDGPLTEELDNVITEFKNQYPNLFNVISLPQNVGLGPALAIGIHECKNELIARMDSDDIISKDRCEKQLKCFERDYDLDIVGCYEFEFEEDINDICSVHKVPEKDEDIKRFMKRRCAILHPTVIYKKEAVLRSGNYRDVCLYEDYDLFMRMVLEYDCKAYNIPEGLYYMRINSAFYKRRGGISYLVTVIKFKYNQYKKGYMSKKDFIVSGGGQAIVCLMPNKFRKWFYMKYLRG